jgi:hypothetical protein
MPPLLILDTNVLIAALDLKSRAVRGSREACERVLAKVPAAAPLPGDER